MFFRLRRAEAASAVWIPHWHSEPCESQGTRAAKGYVNGNLGFRNLLGARRGLRGQFSVQSDNRFSGRGGGWGASPGRGGELGCQAKKVLKKKCEIGVGFSFAALSVFRLRRAEAASALWIPHSLADIW